MQKNVGGILAVESETHLIPTEVPVFGLTSLHLIYIIYCIQYISCLLSVQRSGAI